MRLDTACLLVLSGAACAMPFGGDAFGDEAQAVARRAVAVPLLGAARTAAPAAQTKKLTLNKVASKVMNADPKAVVEQVKAAVAKVDTKKIWEGLKTAAKGMNIGHALQGTAIPLAIKVLEEAQVLSPEHVLQRISQLKGKAVIEYARKFDVSLVWSLYDDLNVAGFVSAVFDADITSVVKQVRPLTASQLVDAFAALTPQKVGDWVTVVLDAFGLGKYLDTYGINLGSILSSVLPASGAEVLKAVEAFDGEAFLKWFAALNGDGAAELANKVANDALTKAREVAAKVAGKAAPAAFTGFDLYKEVSVLQEFAETLAGVKFPSVVDEIKTWSGQRQLDAFKNVTMQNFVEAAVAVAQASVDIGLYGAKIAQKLWDDAGKDGQRSLVGMAAEVVKKLNGAALLNYLSSINPAALVQKAKEYDTVRIVADLAGFDVAPYLDAFAKVSPKAVLANVQKLKGSRLVKLVDDLGLTAYLNDFPGIDFKTIRVLLNAASGKVILGMIRSITGERVLKTVGSLLNIDLMPIAGKTQTQTQAQTAAPKALLGSRRKVKSV